MLLLLNTAPAVRAARARIAVALRGVMVRSVEAGEKQDGDDTTDVKLSKTFGEITCVGTVV
jgi:hypothetical protein